MNEVPYDDMVTVLHKLRHLDGNDLLKVLKKMISPSDSVQIVPPRLLLISDSAMNVHRLMLTEKHLDKAAPRTKSTIMKPDMPTLVIWRQVGEVFTVLGKNKRSTSKSKSTAPSDVVLQQVVAGDRW